MTPGVLLDDGPVVLAQLTLPTETSGKVRAVDCQGIVAPSGTFATERHCRAHMALLHKWCCTNVWQHLDRLGALPPF
jgi:hypothetical protein